MSRQGFTSIEYIEIKFRKPFTGTIQVDTSLDGRSIHSSLTQSEDFVGVGIVKLTPDYSGRWFIVTIIGKFDIRSIEFYRQTCWYSVKEIKMVDSVYADGEAKSGNVSNTGTNQAPLLGKRVLQKLMSLGD